MPVSNRTKNKRYYLGHRTELLEKRRKKIDENRKLPYKERLTENPRPQAPCFSRGDKGVQLSYR